MDLVRVLIIDDDDVDREKIRRLLGKIDLPVEIHEAISAQEARQFLSTSFFDCVILDYQLQDAVGTELLLEIKIHRSDPCPVIMITGLGDERIQTEAMREGVYEYFSKTYLKVHHLSMALTGGLRWAELAKRLADTQDHLQHLYLYDDLTQLPNRNLFFDRLDQSMLAGERHTTPFTLLIIDLDLFHEVNDMVGHEAGNFILTSVAERLKKIVRKSDTVARLEGDSFACLLQGASQPDDISKITEKIALSIRKPIMINEHAVSVDLSIGAAQFPLDGHDRISLLSKADQAMYHVKIEHARKRVL